MEELGPAAVKALETAAACFHGPLCDRCLGRLVGRLEPRGDPHAKGRHLRVQIDVAAPPDEADCAWCEGFFAETDRFAERAMRALAEYEHASFLIATRMHPDVQRREQEATEILEQAGLPWFEPLKMEFNRIVGAVVSTSLKEEVDLTRPDAIAQIDPYFDDVQVTTSSLYLYGRYRKHDRTIPQTRWPCRSCKGTGCDACDHTGQQYVDSVESLVSHVPLDAFDAGASSFHGAGREDIDALMIGTGRPFILEIKHPRWRSPRLDGAPVDLQRLQVAIDEHAAGRAQVTGLRWSEKAEVARVKNGTPDKEYRAHVQADGPVDREALEHAIATIAGADIDQRTPNRVAHRRADKVRRRRVHAVRLIGWGHHVETDTQASPPAASDAPADRFSLDIHAAAGTYIKELVSGDGDRTKPSFAGLIGVPMKVAALDVVSVGDPFAAVVDAPPAS